MKFERVRYSRIAAAGTAVLCGVVALPACGSGEGPSPSPSPSPPTTASGAVRCGKAATVPASGSTAQHHVMQLWIKDFEKACPETDIRYRDIGSGSGQREFLQGRTAFAGTDSPLSAAQRTQSEKVCAAGGRAVHLPVLGGPIAIGFRLPGVRQLTLDAVTLAKIFRGQITRWNDPAIAKLNPDVDLPSMRIQAFHRSDASGTTDNFTSYLRAAAQDAWPYPHGQRWPVGGGRSAKGSSGLAAQVKRTPGAIGYVELAYTIGNTIPAAAIDTGAPSPVAPTVVNASKALSTAKVASTKDDLVLKLDYTSKSRNAYPINMVTYEVVCNKGNKPATWPATKAFLAYIAGESGQQDLSFQGYATLPAPIMKEVRSKLHKMP